MAAHGWSRWSQKLRRRKVFTEEEMHLTDLKRCLSTFELTGLGVGSTLGAGIYVLSGQVAREEAGPAIIISFIVAGLAAALAGLCYGEFASRVPRAGSAYVYSYVTVGELMAFVIGWNILLEYVIGVSSVARSLSAYLDYMLGYRMQTFFQESMPISVPGLSSYPDLFAFGLVMILTAVVGVGVKESTVVSMALSAVNLLVIVVIDVMGFTQADPANFHLSPQQLPDNSTVVGNGGFAPFGFSGVISGSAVCFFAYIGFDFIASLGEEAENPRQAVPISMLLTLVLNLVLYTTTAAMVSLACPYYLLDPYAPLPFVFDRIGWTWAKYFITVGAVAGMASSIMGSILPLTRVTYSMASDGLIFRCLAHVNARFRTPLIGTVVMGSFSGLTALFLDLTQLIHMMSIGTLLAFTLVAVCVLKLRYQKDENSPKSTSGEKSHSPAEQSFSLARLFKPISGTPTAITSRTANVCIASMCFFLCFCGLLMALHREEVVSVSVYYAIVPLLALILLCLVCLACQPQNTTDLVFKVPLVPVIPGVSCVVNIYLMFNLSVVTWLRFAVWLFIGFLMYFCYGIRHSTLSSSEGERTPLFTPSTADDSTFPGTQKNSSLPNARDTRSAQSRTDQETVH